MAATVWFSVLGPVEAWADGRRLSLGPPQQRSVLAVLLVNAGAVTSVDELVDALWADGPPAGAVKTVRTYVSRLRALLRPHHEIIESVGGGYLLRAEAGCFDLARFRQLTASLAGTTSAAERASHARAALQVFRGEPLTGLSGTWAETQRAQLSHLRAATYETLFEAELDAGHHAGIIAELPAVIRQFPFRERLREMQILALYRSGLRAEAFAAYRAVLELLGDELGVEPMPALRDLHRRMLHGDPGLAPPRAAAPKDDQDEPADDRTPTPPAYVHRPAQLPAAPARFTGRDRELRRADELLAASGPGPAVVAISGMGGVGKTSTALHWAHRLATRYSDGQLYVDLHGYGPYQEPLSPTDVLDGFLQALGVTAAEVPEQLPARAAMFRSLVAERRLLILLDNAAEAGQVLDLLPGAGRSLVIVTSRGTLPALVVRTGAPLLTLLPPAREEALDLFAARAGRARVHAEPGAARDIVEFSGRLPLALAVVAARATAAVHLPLSAIAKDLGSARGTLTAFRMPDATFDVSTVLSWSYRALPADTAEAFRRLSLHAGPDLSVAVAASMLARPVAETQRLLAALVAAALVIEHRPDRWTMHDLVRAYGHDLAVSLDDAQTRRATVRRMLDHYLYTGREADARLFMTRQPVVPERPGQGVVCSAADPAAWFGDEHPALLSALDVAAREGFDRHVWQMSWVMRGYLNRQGLWHHLYTSQQAGYAAAVRAGEAAAEGRILWGLAMAESNMGRWAQAQARLQRAQEIFERVSDQPAVERTMIHVAFVRSEQGDWAGALDGYERLLENHPPGTDPALRALALNAVSWAYAKLGRFADAVAPAREALDLAAHLGPSRLADTWDTLGYAHFGLGDTEEGARCYRRAIEIYREHGFPIPTAESLRSFGDMLHRTGHPVQAEQAYRQALTVVAEVTGPRAARLSTDLTLALTRLQDG